MTELSTTELAVMELERTFGAPITTVYRAFTEEGAMRQWGVGTSYKNISLDMDVREGGVIHHRVTAKSDGSMWTFFGVYQTVEPERKIVYTFDWKTDWREPAMPSLVEIEFSESGESTDIKITHSELHPAAVPSTDTHWNEFLDLLGELIENKTLT
jgi:uncharacterized protein YndB with AHSA1/START domain